MNIVLLQLYHTTAAVAALRALGHNVAAVNFRHDTLPGDRALRWADLLIVQQGDLLHPPGCLPTALVERARARGCHTIWWTYDPPETKRPIYGDFARHFDQLVVCTEADRDHFARLGCNVRIDYAGADPGFWRPTNLKPPEFAAHGAPAGLFGHLYPHRQQAIRMLLDAGIPTACWGIGNGSWPWLDQQRIRCQFHATTVNVILPWHGPSGLDPEYLILRHWQIPMCGGFAIAEHNRAVDREFPDMPVFSTLDHMVELVKWHLDRPRRRAASIEACRARARQKFTLKAFYQRMLEGVPS